MARWIRDRAAEHDAMLVLGSAPALLPIASVCSIDGLHTFFSAAAIPQTVADELTAEILQLGAVHVRELGRADWQMLNAWARLREMERRRILAAVRHLA